MPTKTKGAKSVIRRGPSGSKGGSNVFIAIKEDEPANVVPVLPTGNIFSVDLHAFWVVNPAVTFVCLRGSHEDGCPGCDLEDKPGYRAFLPVIDSEGEMKILGFGISVERQLVTLEDELGSIVGKKLRIKRTGNGLGTKYQVINLGKEIRVDFDEDEAEKFVESHIEVKDRDKIIEELTAAGLMGKKKKSKVVDEDELDDEADEEEVDEEESDEDESEEDESDEDESDEEEDEKLARKSTAKKTVTKKPVKKSVKTGAKAKKPVKKSSSDW